ncbi:hypothetical protein Acsp05_70250 [Actinokineospora sp. NBRC 105648]|nr:hypothetical protein Acsp05_70250 [Actinokineospora sp. NBRC 105648]
MPSAPVPQGLPGPVGVSAVRLAPIKARGHCLTRLTAHQARAHWFTRLTAQGRGRLRVPLTLQPRDTSHRCGNASLLVAPDGIIKACRALAQYSGFAAPPPGTSWAPLAAVSTSECVEPPPVHLALTRRPPHP